MLVIKSFLKKPQKHIYDLQEVERNPYDFFIHIDHTDEIKKIKKQFDKDYLEGALIITYNGHTILGFTYYDLICQLIAYLLNMLAELQVKNESYSSFPDMPVGIQIKRVGNNFFEVMFDENETMKMRVNEYEFVRTLLDEADHFYTFIITQLNFSKKYTHMLNQIKNLRKIYANDA
jgi:hypothetical protein